MEKKFKCKDEVIFRALVKYGNPIWSYGIFSHYEQKDDITYAKMIGVVGVDITKWEILPYEGNEHLVGTDLPADEEVMLEEGEFIFQSQDPSCNTTLWVFEVYKKIYGDQFMTGMGLVSYIIRFSDFNPNDMEETSRHILCVKNGKIVKYKG